MGMCVCGDEPNLGTTCSKQARLKIVSAGLAGDPCLGPWGPSSGPADFSSWRPVYSGIYVDQTNGKVGIALSRSPLATLS